MDKTTRDIILDVAIELFAEKGYNRVSIREIAQAVGIKGSSIYNHFDSKEAILDTMLELYKEESDKYFGGFYMETNLDSLIEELTIEVLLERSLLMSVGFMAVPRINRIFKVITSELSYSSKCREFFLREFITIPGETLKEIFWKLADKGKVKAEDPELLAVEFYSFVIYKFYEDYILKGESNMDFEKMRREFTSHIRFFASMVRNERSI
ncbi:MAG TPA: helix-turn-helix domain-containing protein [Clostridia bacterium]|nr:helix-turn-helix domain-containing protein [Clostridia bacterium]